MSDPLEPVAQLGKRLQKAAEELGLRMVTFSVAPDPNGEQHIAHASFIPSDDPPAVTPDPEFDAILEAQRKFEIEERAKKDREQLEQLREQLEDPRKGFLDE